MTPHEKNYVHQGWLDPIRIHNDNPTEFQLRLEFFDGTCKAYYITPENAATLIDEMQGSVLDMEQWYEPAYLVCLPKMGRFTHHMGV